VLSISRRGVWTISFPMQRGNYLEECWACGGDENSNLLRQMTKKPESKAEERGDKVLTLRGKTSLEYERGES